MIRVAVGVLAALCIFVITVCHGQSLWAEQRPHPVGTEGVSLISRGKPASSSSQWVAGGWPLMEARYAVDGSLQTNILGTRVPCAITHATPNPWWALDLQGGYYVHSVKVWGRSDGHPQTLPLMVEISTNGINWQRCSTIVGAETHGWPREVSCNAQIATRVRLTRLASGHLTLCEVEVYGVPAEVFPGAQVISRGKPATQSGEWSAPGWPPMFAHYGNDGNYQSNLIATRVSCAITPARQNPWWRVNLQGKHRVYDIHVYGRVDSQQAYPLLVETSVDDKNYTACQTIALPGAPLKTANCNGVEAEYVRLTRQVASDHLSLCEVDVYGFPVVAGNSKNLTIVSRGKPSRLSSTYDWHPLGHMEASYANDGAYYSDIGGRTLACAITEQDRNMAWTVNLQGTYWISMVRIWGRTDTLIQLLPLRVEISTNDWDYQLCEELTGAVVNKVYEANCKDAKATFVRIIRPNVPNADHLTLCEVEVIGEEALG